VQTLAFQQDLLDPEEPATLTGVDEVFGEFDVQPPQVFERSETTIPPRLEAVEHPNATLRRAGAKRSDTLTGVGSAPEQPAAPAAKVSKTKASAADDARTNTKAAVSFLSQSVPGFRSPNSTGRPTFIALGVRTGLKPNRTLRRKCSKNLEFHAQLY
jgi:hypothetical protein